MRSSAGKQKSSSLKKNNQKNKQAIKKVLSER